MAIICMACHLSKIPVMSHSAGLALGIASCRVLKDGRAGPCAMHASHASHALWMVSCEKQQHNGSPPVQPGALHSLPSHPAATSSSLPDSYVSSKQTGSMAYSSDSHTMAAL